MKLGVDTYVRLSDLLEGARKRRTAYRSGRRELFASGLDDLIKDAVPKPKRAKPKEKEGRLIKRTKFASKQRWRVY